MTKSANTSFISDVALQPPNIGVNKVLLAGANNSVFQAAINASSGSRLIVPAGEYDITGIIGVNNIELIAQGAVTLKRPNNSSNNSPILSFNNNSGFKLVGNFIFDGNNLNQTIPAHNLSIINCNSFDVRNITSQNAKYDVSQGGYGDGIYVGDSNSTASNRFSNIIGNILSNNGGNGIEIQRSPGISISENVGSGNGYNGILVQDSTIPVPSNPTTTYIEISRNRMSNNGVGIFVLGDRSGVTSLGDILSQTNQTTGALVVQGNITYNNTLYGLGVQAADASIHGNIAVNNGSTTSNGNMLFNCNRSSIIGNISRFGYYYGMDCGLSINCVISENVIWQNGSTIGQGIGLNLGAVKNCYVSKNHIGGNGGATAGSFQILVSGLDGSGVSWAPWKGDSIILDGNHITLTNSNMTGIAIYNDFTQVVFEGNRIANFVSASPLDIRVSLGNIRGVETTTILSGDFSITAASASTMVIPDWGRTIEITGNTEIDTIMSSTQYNGKGKVSAVSMTNNGSGYTSAPNVVFTDSGATVVPTGVAALAADGKIYGVYVTNPGTGCTNALAVSFTGGGGTGAAATCYRDWDCNQDRVVTLRFDSTPTVKNGVGNIYLSGGDFVATATKSLTIRGGYGNWTEVSRS